MGGNGSIGQKLCQTSGQHNLHDVTD